MMRSTTAPAFAAGVLLLFGQGAVGQTPGQPRPAASNQVEQRTTVSAIDRQNNTISFQGPDNVQRTVAARDPPWRSVCGRSTWATPST